MSRLIDADALIDKLKNAIMCGQRADMPTDELEAVLNDVQSAPTIEPEVDEVCGFYIEELIDIAKRLKSGDDLISRADAIEALEEAKERYFDRAVVIARMQDILRAIPSAQPKIVRCKECKFNYANEHNCEYNPEDIVCTYWASDGLRVDDFCSYGERNSSEKPNNSTISKMEQVGKE